MPGHRYVVFGAGRQGTAAVHDLVLHCDARSVLVVEPNAAAAHSADTRLRALLGGAAGVRFTGAAARAELAGAAAVLSCAPYTANVALTRLALEARVPFLDLGGNPGVVARQERSAARARTPVVPDCGVSPGLSNVLAAHCVAEHGADRLQVRCGGLPLVPPDRRKNPLRYKLVFSPSGLASEYCGRVPVIRGGTLASVAALSTIEEFDDEHEAAPTSNNSPQVARFLRSIGVREYDYMTLRYAGHFALVRRWMALDRARTPGERRAALARRLAADAALRYEPQKDRDKLILCVRARHESGGLSRAFEYRLDVTADARTRFSAMELTTSWGITIVAHHVASGVGAPRGFATPERFVDAAWVLAELEKRLAAAGSRGIRAGRR